MIKAPRSNLLLKWYWSIHVFIPWGSFTYRNTKITPNCLYTLSSKRDLTHFLEYNLCCKPLRVGVLSIKVYIFGEEIVCRINLWSQVYSKSCVWQKSWKTIFSLNCSKMPEHVIHGSNLLEIGGRHQLKSHFFKLRFFLRGNLIFLAKMVKKRVTFGHFGQHLTASPSGLWTLLMLNSILSRSMLT